VVNAVACLCDVMVVVAQVRSVHNRSSFDFFLVIDHPLSPALCPISRAIESDLLRLRLLGLRWCFCLAQPGQSCTRSAVSWFHFSPLASCLDRFTSFSRDWISRFCVDPFFAFQVFGWRLDAAGRSVDVSCCFPSASLLCVPSRVLRLWRN
jgi:hypothetical protein